VKTQQQEKKKKTTKKTLNPRTPVANLQVGRLGLWSRSLILPELLKRLWQQV